MIRRTFQDLCSSERKIEEDALDFVGTDKFAELVKQREGWGDYE